MSTKKKPSPDSIVREIKRKTRRLKQLVAQLTLGKQMLREVLSKML